MSDWCILRTSGRHTLRLVETLAEEQYDAWTPVETVTLRARRKHPAEEIKEPIMPGYVFARGHHLLALTALARSPSLTYAVWCPEKRRMVVHGHPYFRLFSPFGKPELVPEEQLANLRRLEKLKMPKAPLREWQEGDRIRLMDGAYAGLFGTVIHCHGERTTVQIDGWDLPPTVSTRLLYPEVDESNQNMISGRLSNQALHAKAA